MIVVKALSNTVSIGSANAVSDAKLVMVSNPGAHGNVVIQYANGTQYASVPVGNTFPVIIEKSTTDLLVGTNMFAVEIAYRN